MLKQMVKRSKTDVIFPDKTEVLCDVDEEEKETALSLHSEKLVIGFGLLTTGPGTPISDCHRNR